MTAMNSSSFKGNPWVRRVAWLVAGTLVLWALGWLAVPPLLRSQGEKIASEKLGRTVTIGRVQFLPWTLELSVHDLAIASADGRNSTLQVKRIYIDAELQSLLRLAPVVDALEMDEPVVNLTQIAPGRYDIDDVIERLSQPSDPKTPPPDFALYNIVLRGGALDLHDKVIDRTHTLRNVQLSVPFLSSLESQREVKVLPRLAFKLNGSIFDSAAETTPFAQSRKTDATVRLSALDLAPYLGYLPASLPVRLQSAVLDADLRLSFEQAPATVVKLSGQLQVRDVTLADREQRELLSFGALKLKIQDLQPLAHVARISALELDAPRLAVRRDRMGRLNLDWAGATAPAVAAPAPTAAVPEPAKSEEAVAWKIAVDRVAVRAGQVAWHDASLPTQARVDVRDLVLDASAIAVPFAHPLKFSGSFQVAGPDAKLAPAHVAFEGDATDKQAKVATTLQAVPLELASPYLAQFATPRLSGKLDADVGLAWNAPALVAQVARLSLDGVELTCASKADCPAGPAKGLDMRSKDTLAELKSLQVEDARIDLAQRTVTVGRVAMAQPRALVDRAQDGRWMFQRWQVAQSGAASAGKGAQNPAQPWSVHLGEVALDDAAVAFRDASRASPVAFLVSSLRLRLKDFAPLAVSAKPSPLNVSARIGAGRADPGRVSYEGTLGLAPLAAQGKVVASHVPLHAFEPYVAEMLNVDIRRADGSFKGAVRYDQLAAGPKVRVQGDAALDDVRVRMAATGGVAQSTGTAAPRGLPDGEELLNWKSLGLRGIDVALAPGKATTVDIRETALSDFFARLIVQENGRLNLQDLVKSSTPPAAAPSGAPAAAPAAVPPDAPDKTVAVAADAPVIRFGPVAVTGGKVHFSDYFIKPNYSADLSELAGQLSAFSSVPASAGAAPEMADLELRGRAQGTASLEITGKLNPLAKPLALDIQGHVRDLELPPLSPYTIKYAGHGVERGKLSMDVTYRVLPDGQLTASNKLVLNQLTFGDPVQGAPASLPVRLAVALLADRNGVIDVDLPISGSLNDPQFRLGPVIFKIIGNLIMKAVTAPFALLANAFGGGAELGSVAFDAGSAVLNDGAREGLDKVAKMLTDRPALKMTVVGLSSLEVEREAWKREQLQRAVLAQKRRAAQRSGVAAESVKTVEADEYPALLKEVYRRADITKPRNLIGIAKDIPLAEMQALLLASIAVPDDAMRELALARGVAVRDYLASRQLPLERLFLGAPKTVPPDAQWKPHAELTLATH